MAGIDAPAIVFALTDIVGLLRILAQCNMGVQYPSPLTN